MHQFLLTEIYILIPPIVITAILLLQLIFKYLEVFIIKYDDELEYETESRRSIGAAVIGIGTIILLGIL